MKDAIINYINALADKHRPCKHDWEILETATMYYKLNPENEWKRITYHCIKCRESKTIETNGL
jgi:hypothetical protein